MTDSRTRTEPRETSPRPWYFDGRDIFTTGPTDDTGGHRLVVPLPNTFHPSQRVSDADAELIVQAVNEYEALVAVAEAASAVDDEHAYGEPAALGTAETLRQALAVLDSVRRGAS